MIEPQFIKVIDSHSEGEPTRVVIDGFPELPQGDANARRAYLREHCDNLRTAIVCEPRGSEGVVGALLLPPHDPAHVAQTVFFNNVGYLNMCVSGSLGVAATLRHLGRLPVGSHQLETPAGNVELRHESDGSLWVRNVHSYRLIKGYTVKTQKFGDVTGDIAFGGNWFFLVHDHNQVLSLANKDQCTEFTWDIRLALDAARIKDPSTFAALGDYELDHIELYAAPQRTDADSKNFVLCPGKAYDRSPCGTGTSAKIACLVADGELAMGQEWRQESLLGSLFRGVAAGSEAAPTGIVPTIGGDVWITSEATLRLEATDPYRHGIVP